MKKYIDYFFWKRWWFRLSFILSLLFIGSLKHDLIYLLVGVYVLVIFAMMADRGDIGEPDNPYLGCLNGKNKEEVDSFFHSLALFADMAPEFFKEQYLDLRPAEKRKFNRWLKKRKDNNLNSAVISALVN